MKNEKYPIKVAAVRMLASGKSASQVCRELHIGPNSLRLWYQQYSQGGELSLLAKPHAHQKSFEEKAMIIEDIVNNGLSLTAASIKYELAHETLRGWYLSYKSHGLEGLRRKNEATMSKKKRTYTEDELDELERLRLRNEWLEAENALLKKVRALVEEREARQRGTGRQSLAVMPVQFLFVLPLPQLDFSLHRLQKIRLLHLLLPWQFVWLLPL